MATLLSDQFKGEAAGSGDSAWRGLYRAGAACAVLYVLLIIVPLVLLSSAPQPPLIGGAAVLQYIAANKLVYGLLLPLWVALVGWHLYRLGSQHAHATAKQAREAGAAP